MAKSGFVDFNKHGNYFRHKCHKARHDLNFSLKSHKEKAQQVCSEFEPIASKRFTYDSDSFYFESNADLLTFKIKYKL